MRNRSVLQGAAFAFVFGSMLAATSVAEAATISIFNTGTDATGAVVADGTPGDLHYTLTSAPPGAPSTIVAATSASGFPIPPWVGDNSLSRWIGPEKSDLNGPQGTYIYETTFDLTGLNVLTASLTGKWATDNNGVDILINGVSTGFATCFECFGSFSAFAINSGFVQGLNTLAFVLFNGGGTGGSPTGLRVEVTGTADVAAVPLPAGLPLMASGLGLLGYVGWRRTRKV